MLIGVGRFGGINWYGLSTNTIICFQASEWTYMIYNHELLEPVNTIVSTVEWAISHEMRFAYYV